MSLRHRKTERGHPLTAIRTLLDQARMRIGTALPAAVETYNRATRRIKINPSIKVQVVKEGKMEEVPRPSVTNVPVVFPGGGGYILTFPLESGDQVLRVATERGLSNFKRSFQEASPDGSVLSPRNAVAIPGFGPLSITERGEGAVLQNVAGDVWIELHDDRVKIVKGSQTVEIDDAGMRADITGDVSVDATGNISADAGGDIDAEAAGTATVKAPSIVLDGDVRVTGSLNITGSSVTHSGVGIGRAHVHTGVQTGPGVSGPPRP